MGGVARRTREAVLACEAAGFDVVLVETVGVGQSETAVADMVDMFVLLLAPAAGDELQGLKRGIVELADLIVVNKADGALKPAAERAAVDFAGALGLLRPTSAHWRPKVLTASARDGAGIDEVWGQVEAYRKVMGEAGEIAARRRGQARAWLWREVDEGLSEALRAEPAVAARLAEIEARVEAGELTPAAAAAALLAAFRGQG